MATLLSYLPYRIAGGESDSKLGEMRSELRRTRTEISERQIDNDLRRRQVDALKNDTRTIEDIARDELQMLYPHEKTLRLERGAPSTGEPKQ